jgi:hypothetical protein
MAVVVVRAARIVRFSPAVAAAAEPGGAAPDGLHRALVAFHVHTTASDGRGTLDQVTAAAAAAGVDVLVVTDHDVWTHAPREGYLHGVLVLVGSEIGSDDGHVAALGLAEPPFPPSFETEEAIADIQRGGGLAIGTHPSRNSGAGFRFTGPTSALDGIEVVNLDAAWRERVQPLDLAAVALAYPFAPARAIAAACRREPGALALFDDAARARPLLAIGGADAHGYLRSYSAAFGALASVVLLEQRLTGELARDRAAVLDALRRRRVFVSYRALGDPRGVTFVAESGSGARHVIGDVVRLDAGAPLTLRFTTGIDRDADLRILRDGEIVASSRGRSLAAAATGAGAYRAEASLGGPFSVPWLLTNPIFVGMEDQPAAEASPPAPLVPVAAGPPAALLDRLVAESDRNSAIEVDPREPGAALHARFRLGMPQDEGAPVWCALIERSERAVADPATSALVLAGSAPVPLRLDLAITLAGRAEVRYRRSVLLDPEPRTYRFPIASFHGGPGGRLRPQGAVRVVNVLLILQRDNARAGTSGSFTVTALDLE